MGVDQQTLATLLAKQEIRELAMLYSRGVDRRDIELLKTLYTAARAPGRRIEGVGTRRPASHELNGCC